jgi:hypothetical protein
MTGTSDQPSPALAQGAGSPRFPLSRCLAYGQNSLVKPMGDQVSILIHSPPWDLAAVILQVAGAKVSGESPALVQITARVLRGRVGAGVYSRNDMYLLDEVFFCESEGEQTKALYADQLEQTEAIAFRKALEREDALILVSRIEIAVPGTSCARRLENTLFTACDLEGGAVPGVLAAHLTHAEMKRRELGLAGIHVVLLPRDEGAPSQSSGEEPAWPKGGGFDTLFGDVVSLFPAVQGYSLAATRRQGEAILRQARHRFNRPLDMPGNKPLPAIHPDFPVSRQGSRSLAPGLGHAFARQWMEAQIQGRKLITLTFGQARPSRLAAWGRLARSLDLAIYAPVLVPDSSAALLPLPTELEGILAFPAAAFSLGLRLALYDLACLNLSMDGQASILFALNPDCRFIDFKPDRSFEEMAMEVDQMLRQIEASAMHAANVLEAPDAS